MAVLLSVVLVAFSGSGATTVGGRLGGDYPEFYGAGRIVRHGDGHRLYDAEVQARSQRDLYPEADRAQHLDFAYPPAVAALYVPLTLLPYRASYVVYSVLLMAALAAAVLLLRPAVAAVDRRPWVAYAAALTAYPMFRAVGAGQNTALTVLLVAAWWRWRSAGRPFLAGVAAGLLLYKPQFAVLFLVAVLLDRSRSAVVGAALAGAGLWAAGVAVTGLGWVGQFLDHARQLPALERGVADTTGISLPSVVGDVFGDGAPAGAVGAALVLAAAVVALAVWARRRDLGGVGALAAAAVLVPPHVVFYDAGLLVLTGAGLVAAGDPRAARWCAVLWVASFSGLVAGALGVNPLALVAAGGLAATAVAAARPQALVSDSRT